MSNFKSIAKEAKNRLKNGFWDKVEEEKIKAIEVAKQSGKNVVQAESTFMKNLANKIKNDAIGIPLSEDEVFYQKVCKIMEADEVITNPLSHLIDHSVYDNLGERGKQSYILKLSGRFAEMKRKYKKEHDIDIEIAY